MPVGAVLASERVVETVARGGGFVHGFTFSHNPVTAAACLATLDILEKEDLVERSRVLGEKALARLGAPLEDILDVKRRIDKGEIPGPRLFVATRALAPTGMYPPLIPLPQVRRSGTTPLHSVPNQRPVRPKPVITSSSM